MMLQQFDVRGEQINDDETDTMIRASDPSRSLVRYRADGSELFVHTRINVALLQAAVSLPILLLKPQSREDELMPTDALLAPEGSRRNYELLERICTDVTSVSVPACYLAEQHGEGRRDFYFVTEDVAGFERIARSAAAAFGFPLTIERYRLAELAPIILPAEAIGDLGIQVAPRRRVRPTLFYCWGGEPSITRLRTELERRGYQFVSLQPYLGELQMIKEVPIDGLGFRAVLQDIAPLAHSLACRYCGTETIGGIDQFSLLRPLPERYAAAPATGAGLFRRVFGRRATPT